MGGEGERTDSEGQEAQEDALGMGLTAEMAYSTLDDGEGSPPPESDGHRADDGSDDRQDDGPGRRAADRTGGKDEDWNRRRQDRDQDAANERKAVREQMQQLTGVVKQLGDVVAGLRQPDHGKDQAAEAARQIEQQLDKAIEDLTEHADAEQLVGTIRQLAKFVRDGRPAAGEPEGLKKISEQIANLGKAVDGLDKRVSARDDTEELNEFLAGLDHRFGAEFRDRALEVTKQQFLDRGFYGDDGRVPSEEAVEVALQSTYYQLYVEKHGRPPRKTNSRKPPARTPPRKEQEDRGGKLPPDSGRGGRVAGGHGRAGPLSRVLADMEREGLVSTA